jgi:hypothetical protein
LVEGSGTFMEQNQKMASYLQDHSIGDPKTQYGKLLNTNSQFYDKVSKLTNGANERIE